MIALLFLLAACSSSPRPEAVARTSPPADDTAAVAPLSLVPTSAEAADLDVGATAGRDDTSAVWTTFH